MNLARFPAPVWRRCDTASADVRFPDSGGPNLFINARPAGFAAAATRSEAEFVVADAWSKGGFLITCGAVQSNHCA